jgi:hypothetical protein
MDFAIDDPEICRTAFRNALSLIAGYLADDDRAMTIALSDIYSSPQNTAAVVSAFVQIVLTVHQERPDDLLPWLNAVIFNIVTDEKPV